MKPVVILPTYNERENIEKMVHTITGLNIGLDILIVDDNSPDGTGDIAEKLKQSYKEVDVLHRKQKAGLGRAYVHAFKVTLEKGYDRLITMDCDFSHDPKVLPNLLATTEKYDIAIGSRYVKGGGVRGWGIKRKILSKGGSTYARLILGLPYHDLTGGFRCIRSQVLETVGVDNISSDGYVFQIELAYKAHRKGFRAKEIPIIFIDRREGVSKMSPTIAMEAMWKVWYMRLR